MSATSKLVRREIARARNAKGMRAGMPKVTLDAAIVERLCIEAEAQPPADEQIVNALQEVADCTLFNAHDPTDCTEQVYETVSALIQDARAALQGEK